MTPDRTSSGSSGGPSGAGTDAAGEAGPALIGVRGLDTDSGLQVLLQVRLWTAESTNPAALPNMARAMLKDLVSASGGEIRDGGSIIVAAVFHEPAKAIHVTRQIHRLLQGYSRAAPGVRLGGCFILSRPEEGKLAELDVRGRLPRIASAYSGQILVAASLGKAVQALPGVRLEGLEQGSLGNAGIFVLLPPAEWKGHTGNLPELWAPLPAAAETGAGRGTAGPGLDTMMLELTSRPLATVETDGIIPEPVADDISTKLRTLYSLAGKPRRLWFVGGGVAAVLAIAAALLVARGPGQHSPAPSNAPGTTSTPGGAGPPAMNTNRPAVPQSSDQRPPVSKPEKELHAEDPHTDAKRKADKGRASKPRDSDTGGLSFSLQELNLMLANADRDAGNGDYDKAIREYHTVLRHQPNNQRAVQGLARGERNQAEQTRLQGRAPE